MFYALHAMHYFQMLLVGFKAQDEFILICSDIISQVIAKIVFSVDSLTFNKDLSLFFWVQLEDLIVFVVALSISELLKIKML